MQTGVNWLASRAICLQIGYTLFRIDSIGIEKSFAKYLASKWPNQGGLTYWLNGIGNADTTWSLVDPAGPFTYLKTATSAGMCFFYYYGGGSDKYQFQQKDCAKQVSYCWCEA